MTPEISTLLSTLPPVLVLLAAFLILHAGPKENAASQLLLYYLGIGAAFTLALFVSGVFDQQDRSRNLWVMNLLFPALVGVLTLLVINLRYFKELNRHQKVLFILFGVLLTGLLVGISFQTGGIGLAVAPGALLLALFWTSSRKSTAATFTLGLVALISLGILNSDTLLASESTLPRWALMAAGILALLGPVLAIVLAAIFITRGLKELEGERGERPPRALVRASAWVALAVVLLGTLVYTTVWSAIWDQTSDGLGGALITSESSLVGVGAGMLMALAFTGKRRAAGIAFAVLVPVLVTMAAHPRWLIYHSINEERAARIQQAVESFHARIGRYPAELGELVPRDLLWVPNPVIFRGEGWCYQGGDDFYRLGAVYREFFSAPISVHVYASQGVALNGWDCDQRAARLQARYGLATDGGGPMYPVETAMPPSQLPVEAKIASLLVKARDVYAGGWSPDGGYLVLGIPQGGGMLQEVELAFLDVKTGQVCPVSGRYQVPAEIRGQYAWLPDGRLLFLPMNGDPFLTRPCQGDIERLAGRFPETMTGIFVPTQKNLKAPLLLKSASSFWILSGENLDTLKIQEVTPNPYELHWDQAAWSPGGDRLAISRLNGREKKDGATLFIVSTATGQVQYRQAVKALSDQSPPWVEWLSDHEILLDVQGDTSLMDLNTSPITVKRVMRDLLGLDVAIPDEISTWGSFVEPSGKGYHLAVRVNLPRNQAIYVYHSETGKVETLHSQGNAALFFPGGDWAQFTKLETSPSYQDEFELFWVDEPGKTAQMLEVMGHTPRSYPVLFGEYLPEFNEIAFSSSQGVSLVSIGKGKTAAFWRLAGRTSNIPPSVLASPDGGSLVVIAPGDGVYWIRVER